MLRMATTALDGFPIEDKLGKKVECVNDQISLGIDYPALPISLDARPFLEPFIEEGCLGFKGGEFFSLKDIECPPDYYYTNDMKFFKKAFPDAKFNVYLPGVFTLGSVIKFDSEYIIDQPDLLFELAGTISKIFAYYEKSGAFMLTIQEPNFSAFSKKFSKQKILHLLNTEVSQLKTNDACGAYILGVKALHLPGDINEISNALLRSNFDLLVHQFKSYPENFNAYTKTELERSYKTLGLGCITASVNSKTNEEHKPVIVEAAEDVEAFLSQGVGKFGLRNILACPESSFKSMGKHFLPEMAYEVAYSKLDSMATACKALRQKFQNL